MKLLNKSEKGLKFLISKKYIAIISILILIIMTGCITEEAEEELIPPTQEQPAETPDGPVLYVNLTADKKMTIPDTLTIKKGTTIIWTNLDKNPHNLIIYDRKDPDLTDDDLIRSENLYQGESYEYTFDKRGTFVVKDVYSGQMRSLITANVVLDLKSFKTIIVE